MNCHKSLALPFNAADTTLLSLFASSIPDTRQKLSERSKKAFGDSRSLKAENFGGFASGKDVMTGCCEGCGADNCMPRLNGAAVVGAITTRYCSREATCSS